jgi:hypothetical protein
VGWARQICNPFPGVKSILPRSPIECWHLDPLGWRQCRRDAFDSDPDTVVKKSERIGRTRRRLIGGASKRPSRCSSREPRAAHPRKRGPRVFQLGIRLRDLGSLRTPIHTHKYLHDKLPQTIGTRHTDCFIIGVASGSGRRNNFAFMWPFGYALGSGPDRRKASPAKSTGAPCRAPRASTCCDASRGHTQHFATELTWWPGWMPSCRGRPAAFSVACKCS